jgi:type VI secretion system protein ImpH
MGAESGQPDTALIAPPAALDPIEEYLRAHPAEFSFFQAIRLLQRMMDPEKPLGVFTNPAQEPVRLAANAALSFPPSEIQRLEERKDGPLKMTVNFFGLHGASGTLPTRYTELMLERLYARDATLRDFLDLFNHRMISLLYRAWEKYRFPVKYERNTAHDPFTGYMLDLIGLGTKGLQNRQPVPDQVLIGYGGLLAQYPRSALAFRQMLSDYFEVPVEVLPFSGTWRPLDADSRTCLDEGRTRSEQLGVGIVLGDEIWDQQSVVRVRLGPMSFAQYRDFLPDGSAFEPLKALSRFFCGDDLDVEVQLVLNRKAAPPCTLDVEEAPRPRLGWFSWMFTRPLERDPDETVLRLWDELEAR